MDGDLRNPAAHKLFGMTAGPGFSELLRGEMEPGQVVQNTPLENLSLLAAGACDRQALQALAQEGILRNVFDELKEQYDFLIVDVSPILPVVDALLVGEHADAVLLSVLRNVSRLPAVYAAQQRLASLGIRVLGAVVIGEGMEAYGQVRYPSSAGEVIVYLSGEEISGDPHSHLRGRPGRCDRLRRRLRRLDAALARVRRPRKRGRPTSRSARAGRPLAGAAGRAGPGCLDMAGAKGWWVRRFTNERTGTSVLVILLCGRAGPLSVHKPETCYTGAGYALASAPVRYTVRDEAERRRPSFGPAYSKSQRRAANSFASSGRGLTAAPGTPPTICAGLSPIYQPFISSTLSAKPTAGRNASTTTPPPSSCGVVAGDVAHVVHAVNPMLLL